MLDVFAFLFLLAPVLAVFWVMFGVATIFMAVLVDDFWIKPTQQAQARANHLEEFFRRMKKQNARVSVSAYRYGESKDSLVMVGPGFRAVLDPNYIFFTSDKDLFEPYRLSYKVWPKGRELYTLALESYQTRGVS